MKKNPETVRAYHACRPLDPSQYLQEGIRAWSGNELIAHYKNTLLTLFPGNVDVEKVDEDWYDGTQEKKVYFERSLSELCYLCGHYALFGSEAIFTHCLQIFSRLGDRTQSAHRAVQKHLMSIGIPTIFHVDVPIESIPEYWRGAVNAELGGFLIKRTLEPSLIYGHSHPRKLFNVYERRWEINELTVCSLCESSQCRKIEIAEDFT